MVDVEYDEDKLWDPIKRQEYMDNLPPLSLFEDHIIEGDVMVDAIQALIEEGETAESLAYHWKQKGNEMFLDGKKHNRMYFTNAIQYYSDALAYANKALALPLEERQKDYNLYELIAQIYNNRAAVHLELKNYGSCRSDAAMAIRFDSSAIKAYFRGAKASRALRKHTDTLRYCEAGLKIDPTKKLLLKLQEEGIQLVEELRIEQEQKDFEHKKRRALTDKYRKLCEVRNVKVGPAVIDDERVRQFEGKAELEAESGYVYWPALFLYAEYNTTDFIQYFGEQDTFIEHLANIFPEDGPFAEWDETHSYVASNLVIYAAADIVPPFGDDIERWHIALSGESESEEQEVCRIKKEELLDAKTQVWIHVSPFCTLHQLISHENYVVPGIPVINIFRRNSPVLDDFLKRVNERNVIELKEHQR